jgi:hypothetical protein
MWMRLSALSLVLVLAMPGCDRAPDDAARTEPPVFQEHVFKQAATATLEAGQDCSEWGATGCKSNLCIHVSPDPRSGYFCSVHCQQTADCPRDWRCVRLSDTPEGQFCTPPASWQGQVATARQKVLLQQP